MTASKIPEPVMLVTPDEFDDVLSLGNHLRDEGLYVNQTEFPDPPVALALFTAELATLEKAIAAAPGNKSNITIRDKQSAKVHGLMKQDLTYVKPICNGNPVLIKKSGFPSSSAPSAHPLAPQAVIKKIVSGPGTNTVKIMMQYVGTPENNKRENRSYIVYVYDEGGKGLVRTGCVSTNSRNLIITEVPFMATFQYSVAIRNAAGINQPSAKIKFTLTDS